MTARPAADDAFDRDASLVSARGRLLTRSRRRMPTTSTGGPLPAGDHRRAARRRGAVGARPGQLGGAGADADRGRASRPGAGRGCSATAMVFAMHQIQVATIVRHLRRAATGLRTIWREVAADQRLIASVTSEIGTGGDMGRSIAAVTAARDGRLHFEKQAPTVSYGAYADDLLDHRAPLAGRRARRPGARAAPGRPDRARARGHLGHDRHARDLLARLHRARELHAGADAAKHRSRRCMNESMVPLSHILWSHVWLGIATEAFDRGRALRARGRATQARRAGAGGAQPLAGDERADDAARGGAARLCASSWPPSAEPGRSGCRRWPRCCGSTISSWPPPSRRRAICAGVLEVIGIAAYKNDSRSASAVTCATPFGAPDGRQRADPRDRRRAAADRQGRLEWPREVRTATR